MGVVVVTDVFCDKCCNWGNHSSGSTTDKGGALKSVKEAGWEIVTTADGERELHCPECLGKAKDFWRPWYDGNRGVAVRWD